MSEATNRNLYIHSIVTATLLPINLITGIFGMNTGGLPWGEEDLWGFWWVISFMVIAVIAALKILHRNGFYKYQFVFYTNPAALIINAAILPLRLRVNRQILLKDTTLFTTR
jgi:hypothetical protein